MRGQILLQVRILLQSLGYREVANSKLLVWTVCIVDGVGSHAYVVLYLVLLTLVPLPPMGMFAHELVGLPLEVDPFLGELDVRFVELVEVCAEELGIGETGSCAVEGGENLVEHHLPPGIQVCDRVSLLRSRKTHNDYEDQKLILHKSIVNNTDCNKLL